VRWSARADVRAQATWPWPTSPPPWPKSGPRWPLLRPPCFVALGRAGHLSRPGMSSARPSGSTKRAQHPARSDRPVTRTSWSRRGLAVARGLEPDGASTEQAGRQVRVIRPLPVLKHDDLVRFPRPPGLPLPDGVTQAAPFRAYEWLPSSRAHARAGRQQRLVGPTTAVPAGSVGASEMRKRQRRSAHLPTPPSWDPATVSLNRGVRLERPDDRAQPAACTANTAAGRRTPARARASFAQGL